MSQPGLTDHPAGVLNIITDIMLIVMPIPVLVKLRRSFFQYVTSLGIDARLTPPRKIQLYFLFSLGIFIGKNTRHGYRGQQAPTNAPPQSPSPSSACHKTRTTPPRRSTAPPGPRRNCSRPPLWPTHRLCTPCASGKRDQIHPILPRPPCLPRTRPTTPVKKPPARGRGPLRLDMSFGMGRLSKHADILRWRRVGQTRIGIRVRAYW